MKPCSRHNRPDEYHGRTSPSLVDGTARRPDVCGRENLLLATTVASIQAAHYGGRTCAALSQTATPTASHLQRRRVALDRARPFRVETHAHDKSSGCSDSCPSMVLSHFCLPPPSTTLRAGVGASATSAPASRRTRSTVPLCSSCCSQQISLLNRLVRCSFIPLVQRTGPR